MQMLQAFCVIAHYNETEGFGLNMGQLGDRLGMVSATRSRTISRLGIQRGGNRKEQGLGLIETGPDPDDPRAKIVFLTPKGRRLWAAMKQAVERD